MQRNYPYRGFTINVSVETYRTVALSRMRMGDMGCVAVVRVFREGQDVPLLGPIRLTDNDGRWFASEADALLAGGTAGQRAIDDLNTTGVG
jgi:excinuclease UvrABC helicase subunit UvrB